MKDYQSLWCESCQVFVTHRKVVADNLDVVAECIACVSVRDWPEDEDAIN